MLEKTQWNETLYGAAFTFFTFNKYSEIFCTYNEYKSWIYESQILFHVSFGLSQDGLLFENQNM